MAVVQAAGITTSMAGQGSNIRTTTTTITILVLLEYLTSIIVARRASSLPISLLPPIATWPAPSSQDSTVDLPTTRIKINLRMAQLHNNNSINRMEEVEECADLVLCLLSKMPWSHSVAQTPEVETLGEGMAEEGMGVTTTDVVEVEVEGEGEEEETEEEGDRISFCTFLSYVVNLSCNYLIQRNIGHFCCAS